MKAFLIAFIITFVIFFYVGYTEGEKDVSAPDFLQTQAFKNATIIESNETYYLAIKKDTTALLLFNVDSDSLIKIDNSILLNLPEASINDKNIIDYLRKNSGTIIGAGAIGFTIKDFLVKGFAVTDLLKSPEKRNSILGVILGGISGYSVGYKYATKHAIPKENSPEISNILINDLNWSSAKKKIFESKVKSALLISLTIKDEIIQKAIKNKLVTCYQKAIQKKIGKNFSSSDFGALLYLDNLINKQEKLFDPQKNKSTSKAFHLLWIIPLLAGIGFVIWFYTMHYLHRKRAEDLKNYGIPANINEAVNLLDQFISNKQKFKFQKTTSGKFYEDYNYKLGRTIVSAWNLDWDNYPESKKATIHKPLLIGYFELFGVERPMEMKKFILISFHNYLMKKETDFSGQLKEFLDKKNSRLSIISRITPMNAFLFSLLMF